MSTGLEETAELFEPVRELFGWVYRVAHELSNHEGLRGSGVRGRRDGLIREMVGVAQQRSDLAEPLGHFVKVSRSYEPGLFHCYDVAELPRTNNDLGQLFGSHRRHERRCSGREVASPGLVVRRGVRLVAGVVTRLGEATVEDLVPVDVLAWAELRAEVGYRESARVQQRRFRRDPTGYLRHYNDAAGKGGRDGRPPVDLG